MIDNYYKRFGLARNPFVKNKDSKIIETKNLKALKFDIEYLVATKGMGVIIGEPGLGKTTALRYSLQSLSQSKYKVIYISMASLTTIEFYRNLGAQFGVETETRKYKLFSEIQNQIKILNDAKRITPIIVLDEANYMKSSTLSDLKMLLNFDMDASNKAVLILCGTSNLSNILRLQGHEALYQRITSRNTFDKLTAEQMEEYIRLKIESEGGNMEMFTPGTLQAVINGSGCVPRIADNIMDKLMVIHDKSEKEYFDLDIVKKVISSII